MSRAKMLADDDMVRALFDRAIDLGMTEGWVGGSSPVDGFRSRQSPGGTQAFDVEADDEDGERVERRVTLTMLRSVAERFDPLDGEGYEWLARSFNASPASPVRGGA